MTDHMTNLMTDLITDPLSDPISDTMTSWPFPCLTKFFEQFLTLAMFVYYTQIEYFNIFQYNTVIYFCNLGFVVKINPNCSSGKLGFYGASGQRWCNRWKISKRDKKYFPEKMEIQNSTLYKYEFYKYQNAQKWKY